MAMHRGSETVKIVMGAVAGLIAAFACIAAFEFLDQALYPLPPGFNIDDPAQMRRLMTIMPTPAIALVALGWFAGALRGGYLADRIGRRALPGWIVAALILVAAVANMAMIPHPAWMWAAGIILPVVAAWLAQRLAKVAF